MRNVRCVNSKKNVTYGHVLDINSISKEIVDAFIYTTSLKKQWEEILERYGESNGPFIYQLQRKISSISQENAFISIYFTKLKRLWDVLSLIEVLHSCTCGVLKEIVEIASRSR